MGSVQVAPQSQEQHRVHPARRCLMVVETGENLPRKLPAPSRATEPHWDAVPILKNLREVLLFLVHLQQVAPRSTGEAGNTNWVMVIRNYTILVTPPLAASQHSPQAWVSSEVLPSARASQMNPQLTAGMGREPYKNLCFLVFYGHTFAKGNSGPKPFP